jgi:hypothetical protein
MTRLCQYGNCDKYVTVSANSGGVSVNYHNEEKPVFCCGTHAALWLLGRDGHKASVALLENKLDVEPS